METSKEQTARHEGEAIATEVLSYQIHGLKELMLEKLTNQDNELRVIREQTIKTNGHVAEAFRDISDINLWRATVSEPISTIKQTTTWRDRVSGGLIVANVLIVPIVLWLVYERLKS